MKNKLTTAGILIASLLVVATPAVYAATTADSQLTQTINNGVISTDFRSSTNGLVASPSFSLGATTVSTSQTTATGTFGSDAQRISVDNPGGANGGWSLAIAATNGEAAVWTSGSNTYDFNGTTANGQMVLDPSVATLTPTGTNTATGISLGIVGPFVGSTPITLLTAASTAEDVWNGYLTGVGVSQTIPASTPAGNYSLILTQTVTAN